MRKDLMILTIVAFLVVGGAIYFATRPASVPTNTASNTNGATRPAGLTNEQLIKPDSASIGPENAKVTVVEFYDPECEACAAFHPVMKRALKGYEGRVRLVMRYMPLHPNSMPAATFIEAAAEQGKYWEAQEMLFTKQPEWGTKHGPAPAVPVDINALFRKYAAELGLDAAKMNAAFSENRYAAKINRDKADGQAIGARQTPTVYVNGYKLSSLTESGLKTMIEAEMAR
jgi:protein-disulfide isomerase